MMWTRPVETVVSHDNAAVGVLLEDSVEDSVRYLVADLIGMSLGLQIQM